MQPSVPSSRFVLLFISAHSAAEKCQGFLAMLCCTTCLADFQKSVLAGGVTIWVDIDAKLDFSIIASQHIVFFFFLPLLVSVNLGLVWLFGFWFGFGLACFVHGGGLFFFFFFSFPYHSLYYYHNVPGMVNFQYWELYFSAFFCQTSQCPL